MKHEHKYLSFSWLHKKTENIISTGWVMKFGKETYSTNISSKCINSYQVVEYDLSFINQHCSRKIVENSVWRINNRLQNTK